MQQHKASRLGEFTVLHWLLKFGWYVDCCTITNSSEYPNKQVIENPFCNRFAGIKTLQYGTIHEKDHWDYTCTSSAWSCRYCLGQKCRCRIVRTKHASNYFARQWLRYGSLGPFLLPRGLSGGDTDSDAVTFLGRPRLATGDSPVTAFKPSVTTFGVLDTFGLSCSWSRCKDISLSGRWWYCPVWICYMVLLEPKARGQWSAKWQAVGLWECRSTSISIWLLYWKDSAAGNGLPAVPFCFFFSCRLQPQCFLRLFDDN